jgi:hypothetical protein
MALFNWTRCLIALSCPASLLSVYQCAALCRVSDLGGEQSWLKVGVEEWGLGSLIWLMDAAALDLKNTKLFGKRMAEKQ